MLSFLYMGFVGRMGSEMGEQGKLEAAARDVARLAASEKAFWTGLWEAPIPDTVYESGVDVVRFGPIHAACVAEVPRHSGVNFILGASEAGAVSRGHLGDAARWLGTRRSAWSDDFGVDYRVPVIPGLPEAAAAEDWLREHGHVRDGGPAKLVRDATELQFSPPADIEVLDWEEWDEGFGSPLVESLGLSTATETFFLCLLEEEDWRCYCGIIGDDPLAYVAMHVNAGVASIALASRPYPGRDGDGQLAVLHRCMEDAMAEGCDAFVLVDAGGEPPVIDHTSLVRAGFEVAYRVPSWRSAAQVAV
jgi:hypothetical protein